MQNRVTELNRMRSKHHDAAIASVSAVNRIPAVCGVGPICTGAPAIRRQAAAFCLETVNALFENRKQLFGVIAGSGSRTLRFFKRRIRSRFFHDMIYP